MRLFPERAKSARRFLLWALLLSLVVHLVGGPLLAWLGGLMPESKAPAEVAQATRITIQHLKPLATPRPTPTPPPAATPTPIPTPTPFTKPRVLETLAPHAVAHRVPSKGFPHHPAVKNPTGIVKTRPVHAPTAPPVIARHVELARPHAPGHRAPSALNPQDAASLDEQFRQTIAQAQKDVAQGPPTTPPGGLQTMKQYDPVLQGTSADTMIVVLGGDCYALDTPQVHNGYVYYSLSCRTRYSDGFTEQVVFPWQFRFPQRDDPMQTGRRFGVQAPPDGFVLPDPFPMSRMVCDFYRTRCAAVIAKERANGTANLYGKPP